MSGNVSKHVAVVHELSRLVEANGLLEASQLEQELACAENRQEHFKAVSEALVGQSITNMERLRLVILYALRYEHDGSISQLKDLLRNRGIGDDQVALVDQVLRYAGSHARSNDLFQNKSFFAQAKSAVASSFKGVENVYTQHKTHLGGVVESLMKGRLKDSQYPFIDSRFATPGRDQVPRAVVFVVGGTTFEEARDIAELNKTFEGGRCVILGGTTVHNSRSFLADVAQLGTRTGQE